MYLLLLILGADLCFALPVNHTGALQAVVPPQTLREDTYWGRVVFEDTFSRLDLGKWDQEVTAAGGGNWEFQVYTPEARNTFTRDNTLFIEPTMTADKFGEDFLRNGVLDMHKLYGRCTQSKWNGCYREGKNGLLNPIMSGKLMSKKAFLYGRMEVMAKLPRGDWIWPAIWMMPRESAYGGWPRSGEIDVCEARGNRNFGNIGINRMESTMHWGIDPGQNKYRMTHGSRYGQGHTWADGFHKYVLQWNPDGLTTWVDDKLVMEIKTPRNGYYAWGGFNGPNIWAGGRRDAPFDKAFYIIMNVAVGGTNGYFPDGVSNNPRKPWSNRSGKAPEEFWNGRSGWQPTWQGSDASMQVKWVRYWQL